MIESLRKRRTLVPVMCIVLATAATACSSDATSSSATMTSTTVASTATSSTSTASSTGGAPTTAATTSPATTAPATTAPATAASTGPSTAPSTAPSTVAPTSAAPAATTAPPATAAPTTVSSGTQPCATSQLHITLGQTDAAAGNQYTVIVFTNGGPSTCTLDGHPGVSFVDTAGNQVGASADRVAGATPTVTLAVGAQAHATIDYHDPGFFDDCAPAATASVKIYPPDQTEAIALPFPSKLCTEATSEPELTIDVIRPGATLTAGEPG